MRISVDISLYPLKNDYVTPILAFIDRISSNPKLIIKRNNLSTQIFGEYGDVMDALGSEMETTFAHIPDSVFVLKLVGNDLSDVQD